MPAPSIERILDRVERELAHLRTGRPQLNGRIDRAESILTTQFGVHKGALRPIRASLHADGSHTYQVASGSKMRTTYTVDPADWSCTCSWAEHGDHDRYGRACCHVLACWILERVSAPASRPSRTLPCDCCGECHPTGELTEIEEDDPRFLGGGPLSYQVGDLLCGECFGAAA